jgi:hypothetical protein
MDMITTIVRNGEKEKNLKEGKIGRETTTASVTWGRSLQFFLYNNRNSDGAYNKWHMHGSGRVTLTPYQIL